MMNGLVRTLGCQYCKSSIGNPRTVEPKPEEVVSTYDSEDEMVKVSSQQDERKNLEVNTHSDILPNKLESPGHCDVNLLPGVACA